MKKEKKTYSPEEKKRRIRRHNAIVYTIAALLFLAGVIIIISDQTLIFPTIGSKVKETYERVILGETPEPQPTLPPFTMMTADPNDFDTHWEGLGPVIRTPSPTDYPEYTLAPGQTPDPNATPRPPYSYTTPDPGPISEFAPVSVYFLDQYIAASINNIVCPVDPVGYNSSGQMDTVHSAYRAGWFRYGGNPVEGGNTLIAGHNRYSGRMGWFAIIQQGKLQPGDIVIVEMRNGAFAYYMVDTVTTYPYDEVPNSVMNIGGRPRLTLITCLGDYSSIIHTSRHRVIAVCYPVYFGDDGLPTSEPTQTPAPTPEPEITPEPGATPDPDATPRPDAGRE